MTTLTDRYVWGVLRSIPEAERAELEPEIRALVADAVEARLADGTSDAVGAERAALIELGDPDTLAARYTDSKQFLLGPLLYPAWKRVVVPVLSIVVPIVTIVTGASSLLGGGTPGEAIVSMLSTGYIVAVMILFWVTLVFALLERTGTVPLPTAEWTPDTLPDVPAPERLGAAELVGSVITSVIVATLIVWQQLQPPIVIDGVAEPLFDPALWSFWLPWFLVVTLIELVFTVALYMRGRWTWAAAVINAALGAAFAIPAIWLIQNGLLLNPMVVDELMAAGGTWLEVTAGITSIVIAVIVAWDAIDGFRKAYVNSKEPVRSLA